MADKNCKGKSLKNCSVAVDLGASGGRLMAGYPEGDSIRLKEIYRFPNGNINKNGRLVWDTEAIFSHIIKGLRCCRDMGFIPETMGICTWGVDYCLLDGKGRLKGDAVGYRDHRTEGIIDTDVKPVISLYELYSRTGIYPWNYNTLFQLIAQKKQDSGAFDGVSCLLNTPDYYNYLLTGRKCQEYTIASTTGMLDPVTGEWDTELMDMFGIPSNIFLPVEKPGRSLGRLLPEIAAQAGCDPEVLLVPSHDTASAFVAAHIKEGEGNPLESLKRIYGSGEAASKKTDSGINMEKSLIISSGTWSLMGTELRGINSSRESMEACFTNEGGYGGTIRYLKNIMGLWMLQSLRGELAPDMDYEEISLGAERADIESCVDCDDNVFLSPSSMKEAIDNKCSETGQQVPGDIFEYARVIYGSLARSYSRTKSGMESVLGEKFDCIRVVGGGSRSRLLNDLTRKQCGCTVEALTTEASALGNIAVQLLSRYKNL